MFQMEDREIKKLLQVQRGQVAQRGWRCPDEIQLAAYVAQGLSSSARNSIEAHVADCDFCLSQVAFLFQFADSEHLQQVPPHLLSAARELVTRKPGKVMNWGWRWTATAAAAACFALLFVVIVLQLRRQESASTSSGPLVAQQTSPEMNASPQLTVSSPPAHSGPSQPAHIPKAKPTEPAVRNSAGEMLPRLIAPRDGEVIRREDLEFRWEPVTDAVFYDVRVMSADGDLVFVDQTESSRLKPGSTTSLAPGRKYFAVVRAHLHQGKAANSSVVSFRLAEQ